MCLACSTAVPPSPSSTAVATRCTATLVGPNAVHMQFASRPNRCAARSASASSSWVSARSPRRELAIEALSISDPYTDSCVGDATPSCP